MKKALLLLVALAMLLIAVLLGIHGYAPPRARDKTASRSEFSAGRAAEHLSVIAREPHPFGSVANRRVADYIYAVLTGLDYSPVLMPVYDADRQRAGVNVWVKIPGIGTKRAPALLLSAHYDSVPDAPGAGDNGAAVAALLESARLLRHRPLLENDVILLFTDGEESGLLGAQAFVASASSVGEVGLACNFDARGTSGPVVMFETSPGNRALIRRLATEVPGTIATSLSSFVYQRMPNRTDFSVYRKEGISGLNFAFIRGSQHYHSATDTIDHLDLDTLQHVGEMMAGTLRAFGNGGLPASVVDDAIYFNVVGPWFVHYPESWSPAMALLLTLIIAVVTVPNANRKAGLKTGAILLVIVLVSGGLSAGTGFAVFKETKREGGMWHSQGVALAIALGLALSLTGAAALLAAKRFDVRAIAGASISVWSLLAIMTIFALPSASYIFYWPAVVGWLTFIGAQRRAAQVADAAVGRLVRRGLLASSSLFAAVFLAPLCLLLWTALPLTLPVVCLFASLFTWPLLAAMLADPEVA